MAKQRTIKQHNTLEEIHELLRKSIDNDFKLRLLVIEKIMANTTMATSEICDLFFINTKTLFRWLKWYNDGGLDKLRNGDGGKGSNAGKYQYDEEIFIALGKEIDNNQDQVWTLEKMQYFIEDQFGVKPTIQAIKYRVKGKYSYKSARPYPKQADRDELGRFKKTV